jgi:hypothetical protein
MRTGFPLLPLISSSVFKFIASLFLAYQPEKIAENNREIIPSSRVNSAELLENR